jgi:hypothetical protein
MRMPTVRRRQAQENDQPTSLRYPRTFTCLLKFIEKPHKTGSTMDKAQEILMCIDEGEGEAVSLL